MFSASFRFCLKLLTAVITLATLVFLFAPRPAAVVLQSIAPTAIYFVENTGGQIALTIDDAPSAEETDAILAVLKNHGVAATFFVIGSMAEQHPDVLKNIRAQGHELANHGWTAKSSISLSSHDFIEDLKRTSVILAPDTPQWFRPGTALFSDRMAKKVKNESLTIVLADVFPQDTVIKNSRFAAWYITHNTRSGSIIVLHDAGDGDGRGLQTAQTLETIIPALRAKGFRFVTLTELTDSASFPQPSPSKSQIFSSAK